MVNFLAKTLLTATIVALTFNLAAKYTQAQGLFDILDPEPSSTAVPSPRASASPSASPQSSPIASATPTLSPAPTQTPSVSPSLTPEPTEEPVGGITETPNPTPVATRAPRTLGDSIAAIVDQLDGDDRASEPPAPVPVLRLIEPLARPFLGEYYGSEGLNRATSRGILALAAISIAAGLYVLRNELPRISIPQLGSSNAAQV